MVRSLRAATAAHVVFWFIGFAEQVLASAIIDAPNLPADDGRPDGATVDSQGNYWCAMFEGQRLLKLSPAGTVLEELALPVRCPTMPCFGGDDLRTLYVTSARAHVIAARVEVPGLPVNFVRT